MVTKWKYALIIIQEEMLDNETQDNSKKLYRLEIWKNTEFAG